MEGNNVWFALSFYCSVHRVEYLHRAEHLYQAAYSYPVRYLHRVRYLHELNTFTSYVMASAHFLLLRPLDNTIQHI